MQDQEIDFNTVYEQATKSGYAGRLQKGTDPSSGQDYFMVGEPGGVFIPVPMQHGTLPEVGVNGLMLEQLLYIVTDRLEGFQAGKYPCQENAEALEYTKKALAALEARAKARVEQGVEGQHVKHVTKD